LLEHQVSLLEHQQRIASLSTNKVFTAKRVHQLQEACGALSNIAFSNALNSLSIARTAGMLQTLVRLVAGRR
jgi:hypothetical protein